MSQWTIFEVADRAGDLRDRSSKYPVKLIGLVLLAALIFAIVVIMLGELPSGDDAMESLMYTVLFFLGGIALFLAGFLEYRNKRLVADTPTSRISAMAGGFVEVKGTVEAYEETLTAPLSGAECIYHSYTVKEKRDDPLDNHDDWVTIDRGTDSVSFWLDDGSGKVLVDPRGADVRIPADLEMHAHSADKLPARIRENGEEMAQELGVAPAVFDPDMFDERKYTEEYITPGEAVYVLGKALERPGEASVTNARNLVVNTDESTPVFLISDRSEKELLSSLSKRFYLFTPGGIVVATVSFWFMLLLVGHF